MTLTAIELHQLLTEARRGAGNDKLTIQQQLRDETEAHAETAKRLQAEIAELKARLAAEIDIRTKDHAHSCGQKNARIAELEQRINTCNSIESMLRDEIRTLKKDIEVWAGIASRDEIQKKQLKAERDEANRDKAALLAEAAALSRDAGYWRALKTEWRNPKVVVIEMRRSGFSLCRDYMGNAVNSDSVIEDSVSLATGYKPEEA